MYVPSAHKCHRVGGKPRFLHSRVFLLTVSFSFKVSILVNSDPEVHEIAFQYGKNVGIAFQVISDLFESLFGLGSTAACQPSIVLISETESAISVHSVPAPLK